MGLFQNAAQTVVVIVNRFGILRRLDVVFDHARLERAGAVERDRCDNIRELLGREALEQTHIERAFHLEKAIHVA